MTGFSALPANVLGGWLWSVVGPSATFALGASGWRLSPPRCSLHGRRGYCVAATAPAAQATSS